MAAIRWLLGIFQFFGRAVNAFNPRGLSSAATLLFRCQHLNIYLNFHICVTVTLESYSSNKVQNFIYPVVSLRQASKYIVTFTFSMADTPVGSQGRLD